MTKRERQMEGKKERERKRCILINRHLDRKTDKQRHREREFKLHIRKRFSNMFFADIFKWRNIC